MGTIFDVLPRTAAIAGRRPPPALLDRIAAVPGLDLRGLHVHIGSQLLAVRREEYGDLLSRDVL